MILAKVIFKSKKIQFQNRCLFYMNLIDNSGIIKCLAYNRDCNRFFNVIKVSLFSYMFDLQYITFISLQIIIL